MSIFILIQSGVRRAICIELILKIEARRTL